MRRSGTTHEWKRLSLVEKAGTVAVVVVLFALLIFGRYSRSSPGGTPTVVYLVAGGLVLGSFGWAVFLSRRHKKRTSNGAE